MSDRDTWPTNPNDVPPKSSNSSSGCFKLFIILGGLGVFCVLLCCGGLGWIGSTFVPKETKNAAEVAQVGQQIMQIEIPPGFKGESAATVDNFFVTFQIAEFRREKSEARLQLMKMEIKFVDLKNQQQNFKGKFQNPANDDASLEIEKTEKRDFVIDGKKISFRFSEAVDPNSKKRFRMVQGDLGTPADAKLLKLVVEDDDYDEDEVVKMIKSIH